MEAVRVAWIEGFDPMVLKDTNIPDKAYCRHKMGYNVVYLEAHTTAYRYTQEGVGMIVWN